MHYPRSVGERPIIICLPKMISSNIHSLLSNFSVLSDLARIYKYSQIGGTLEQETRLHADTDDEAVSPGTVLIVPFHNRSEVRVSFHISTTNGVHKSSLLLITQIFTLIPLLSNVNQNIWITLGQLLADVYISPRCSYNSCQNLLDAILTI